MPKVDGDDDLMDDSEDGGEDQEDRFGGDMDPRHSEDSDHDNDQDSDDSMDNVALAEGSDDEDLIPLNEMDPEVLIEYDGSDAGDSGPDGAVEKEEEWDGISGIGKRKRAKENGNGNLKRKKLRSLPTFASYEDYAKLIEQGPEDDI